MFARRVASWLKREREIRWMVDGLGKEKKGAALWGFLLTLTDSDEKRSTGEERHTPHKDNKIAILSLRVRRRHAFVLQISAEHCRRRGPLSH